MTHYRPLSRAFLTALLAAGVLTSCGQQGVPTSNLPASHATSTLQFNPVDDLSRLATSRVEQSQDNCCAKGMHVLSTTVRIATSDPTWATVLVHGTNPDGSLAEGYRILYHLEGGSWTVIESGSVIFACAAPLGVRSQLDVQGGPASCPEAPPARTKPTMPPTSTG